MKDYEKVVVWVDYFDSSNSRSSGRRIPSHAATRSPTLEELRLAAQNLGFNPDVRQARRPSSPFNVTGYIQVKKTMKKSQLIRRLADELAKVRAQSKKKIVEEKNVHP